LFIGEWSLGELGIKDLKDFGENWLSKEHSLAMVFHRDETYVQEV